MIVSEVEASSDEKYFERNPRRRFRFRLRDGGVWLVHHRHRDGEPNAFVRLLIPAARPVLPNNDRALAEIWFRTIFRGWPANERRLAARRALTR